MNSEMAYYNVGCLSDHMSSLSFGLLASQPSDIRGILETSTRPAGFRLFDGHRVGKKNILCLVYGYGVRLKSSARVGDSKIST